MKRRLVALHLLFLVVFVNAGFAAPKSSRIFAYAGKYNGTVLINAGGTFFPGPASARFTTSKKKETGTLTINSSIVTGGTTVFFTETFKLNKKSVFYTFSEFFGSTSATGVGFGTASISKKTIVYQAPFSIGGTNYMSSGTIQLGKNGLLVNTALSSSGGGTTFTYDLKKKK